MRTSRKKRLDTQALAVATAIAMLIFVIGCREKNTEYNGPTAASSTSADVTPTSSTPEVEVYNPVQPVTVSPPTPTVVTFAEAETAYNERQFEKSEILFGDYVEQNPDNPWGLYMLGLVQRKVGNSEAAAVSFEQAIELDSLHAKSWMNLARANLDLGQPEEALDNIDQAVDLSSESSVSLRLQGRAFYQLGQSDDAIAAYRQAIILDRDDAWSINNLALIYIEQQEFHTAIRALARAVEIDSTIATFHNNLGMALENTNHFRAAEDAYRNAISADTTYAKAETNLSRVEHVEGDVMESEIDLAALAIAFEISVSDWIVDTGTPDTDEADTVNVVSDDEAAGTTAQESPGPESGISELPAILDNKGSIEF